MPQVQALTAYKDAIAVLTTTEGTLCPSQSGGSHPPLPAEHSGVVVLQDEDLLETLEETEPSTKPAEQHTAEMAPSTSRVMVRPGEQQGCSRC